MATATKSDKFAAEQELKQDEKELRSKYPDGRIVQGTLKLATSGKFEGKRTVKIKCKCGAVREVATSDIFHVHGRCEDCVRKDRNAARSAARINGKHKKTAKKAKASK